MIKVGYGYKSKFPKQNSNGTYRFQITDYDKMNPTDPNYITVFANNNIEVTEGMKIRISSLLGVGVKHYKGKMQITINADIEVDGEAAPTQKPITESDFNTGPIMNLNADDLPF